MDSDSDEQEAMESEVMETEEKGGLSSCGYCGRLRKLGTVELMCSGCGSWFHEACISYQLGALVPFCVAYSFTCRNCSPNGVEHFKKGQAQLRDMCVTALANLIHSGGAAKGRPNKEGIGSRLFSLTQHIIPYLEANWDSITTQPRRATQSWHATLQKTLMKEVDTTFTVEETGKSGEPGPHHPFFGLRSADLTLVRPLGEGGEGVAKGGAGRKRKVLENNTSKKGKGDVPTAKLHGYPIDHPFNKEGYRYVLAEPDPHAPFRREFDESSDWAGKPIPGWLYRAVCHTQVLLALHDRSQTLHPLEERLSIEGHKGYSAVRATHGVSRGTWYYEATIVEQPQGAHCRLGWGQELANLEAPIGYDKFGYCCRSRKGTVFNEGHGYSYLDGYTKGDILGCLIHLPPDEVPETLPPTYKDKPLVKFKSHLYYEIKDDVAGTLKDLKPLPGSYIEFYKNGKGVGRAAFKDIHRGTYYPALSLFRGIVVRANFGPKFQHAPEGVAFRGLHERALEAAAEQSVADLATLVEGHDKFKLDVLPQ